MSQPVITATLALIVAVVVATTTAIATVASERLERAIKLLVLAAVVAFAFIVLWCANLRINFTGSVPIGIYLLSPLPPEALKRGMLVAACAPAYAAKLGLQRGYLAAGPCASDTELLLKYVVATGGDVIDVRVNGVSVNGCLLPHSRPVARDRLGRRLEQWSAGRYHLADGQIWLYADNDHSWDSRYWGPSDISTIIGSASPLQ